MEDKRLEATARLLEVMNTLRRECPWDREQTFDSLRNNTIEETYELVDAITDHNMEGIKEELGDLLLHVVFYSKLGEEAGAFDFGDVANALCDKLIYRHPHVYGDIHADTPDDVRENWEALKLRRKNRKSGTLGGVPRSLPAMVKAYRMGEKAASTGFDWERREEVWDKVREELAEVDAEMLSGDKERLESEFGDLFFSLVNACRLYGIDPESALARTNKKFMDRFNYMEECAAGQGHTLHEITQDQMEELWQQAKAEESRTRTQTRIGRAMKLLLFPLLGGLLLASCGSGSGPAEPAPEPIPADAVTFDYDTHLYFDMIVGDSIPARLVFDTGAEGLYLDPLWRERSGFEPQRLTRSLLPAGTGTQNTVVPVVLDSLTFGTDTLRWESTMTPLIDLKSILGRRIDGIFGQKYFDGRCIEFNLRRGYLRAAAPDTLAAAGFVRHAVERRGSRLLVPARVRFDADRIVEGKFLIDMGCGGGVVVNTPAAREAGFDGYTGKTVGYATISGGMGGQAASRLCRADSVGFGGRGFAAVPVSVSLNETGYLARTDVAGLIGNRLLERFDFVIDFAEPALWLRPLPEADEPFPYESCGFSVIDRTDICPGWLVTGLFDGYAPEGLRPGDIVVSWDGTDDPDGVCHTPGEHRIEVLRDSVRVGFDVRTGKLL